MMSIEQLIAENHRLQKELDSMRRQGYNDSIVTNQAKDRNMETFDDISCEEYNAVFGTDEEQFQEWIRDVEQATMDAVNSELRELASERFEN